MPRPPPLIQPYVRRVLTNKSKKFLTASEYKLLLSVAGRTTRDLIADNHRVWRRRGKSSIGWKRLTPAEWTMFLRYARSPGRTFTPRQAYGEPGSRASALNLFLSMRRKVDVKRERLDWELFRSEGRDVHLDPLFTFAPPPEFNYNVVVPYVPGEAPDFDLTFKRASYECSPTTGVFVDVALERRIERNLIVRDATVEIPRRIRGKLVKPHVLHISEVIHDAIPAMLLKEPPFETEEVILRGTWAFDLTDHSGDVILKDGPTDGLLCVVAGSDGQVVRLPIKIHRLC